MYHILVRNGGVWSSQGLWVALHSWRVKTHTLRQVHGELNVSSLHWEPQIKIGKVSSIESRMLQEVELANEAQEAWNKKELCEAEFDGEFNVVRGVEILRTRHAQLQLG